VAEAQVEEAPLCHVAEFPAAGHLFVIWLSFRWRRHRLFGMGRRRSFR
jgi:hypothetical protein